MPGASGKRAEYGSNAPFMIEKEVVGVWLRTRAGAHPCRSSDPFGHSGLKTKRYILPFQGLVHGIPPTAGPQPKRLSLDHFTRIQDLLTGRS